MRIAAWLWNFPFDALLHARLVNGSKFFFAQNLAVRKKLDLIDRGPTRSLDRGNNMNFLVEIRGQVADGIFIVNFDVGEQAHADQRAALQKTLAGGINIDVRKIAIVARNVGAPLSDNIT